MSLIVHRTVISILRHVPSVIVTVLFGKVARWCLNRFIPSACLGSRVTFASSFGFFGHMIQVLADAGLARFGEQSVVYAVPWPPDPPPFRPTPPPLPMARDWGGFQESVQSIGPIKARTRKLAMARAGCVSLLFGSESKTLKTPASHVLTDFVAIKAVAKSAPVSRNGRRRKPAFERLLSGFRAGFRNLFKASGKGRGRAIRAWLVPGAFSSFFGGRIQRRKNVSITRLDGPWAPPKQS